MGTEEAPVRLARCESAGPTADGAGGVPVLAWHGLADDPGEERGSLTVSYARFEELLSFLEAEGFRSVFPEEVAASDGGDDEARRVVLTFDDGTRDHLRAAEILERHGFRGVFFVIPHRIRAGHERLMSPEEVERLARAGHRVAAHGYDHRSMATSGTEVAASLVRSPRLLAGAAPSASATVERDFAFPFGHYTAEVAEALAGRYRFLHTVNPGYWDGSSPLLPRMLVMRDVDPALFRDYVLGGGCGAPPLVPLTPDGAVAGTVEFLAPGEVPEDVLLLAVSADVEGNSYVPHPLGRNLRMHGDTVRVDLAAHVRRWHSAGRGVLGYALVAREADGRLRFLTPGLQHWVRDPAG